MLAQYGAKQTGWNSWTLVLFLAWVFPNNADDTDHRAPHISIAGRKYDITKGKNAMNDFIARYQN